MRNLYEETVGTLERYGKSIEDVVAVQGDEFAISLDDFIELAKKLDYDSGYGAAHVAMDLVIIGDGWWLERREYDGSEWWEFCKAPEPIQEMRSVTALGGKTEMWPRLDTFVE